ncbi:MAG: right-handed parallel beta-helix repeat-containing protein [Bacteroidetes bacterium]|nr:right-handed parallel beta-helix repeat-containing protein [Bacteroidota bacterium]
MAPSDNYGVPSTSGPKNMYKDENNNPLFFVNGSLVYNSHGYLIDDLNLTPYPATGSSYDATGLTEVCIVPNPGNCKQYYIFTSGYNDTSNTARSRTELPGFRPYYALVDVSSTGGAYMPATEYGKNVTPGLSGGGTVVDLFNSTNTPSLILKQPVYYSPQLPLFIGDVFYAATPPRKDGSRLLFMYNNGAVFIYQITASGVSFVVAYSVSTFTNSSGATIDFGADMAGNATELEVYTDTIHGVYKLAAGGSIEGASNTPNAMMFANFSINTGSFVTNSAQCVSIATSSVSIPHNATGIEFSPDGNWVYFTNQPNGNVYQGSVIALSYTNPAVSYTISTDYGFKDSQIELGTDGNLYLLKYGSVSSSTLYKISNSSTPASAVLSSAMALSNYSVNNMMSGASFNSLPDQIDGEVYGKQFNSSLSCCMFYNKYDRQTYNAGTQSGWTGTSQTWSPNTVAGTYQNNPLTLNTGSVVTIGSELRIPAGYTVTINNMLIKFSPQARLIIENGSSSSNGGKLVLNGCTLDVDTRCVQDMWPGVQVWGSPGNNLHSNTAQGFLVLNNSQVQNAYTGTLAGFYNAWASNVTPNPGLPYINPANYSLGTGGGGIVQISGSTFLNNKEDLVVYPYTGGGPFENSAYTTTFTCNAPLLNSSVSPDQHISILSNNSGIFFSGCTISNTAYNYTEYGLYANNSSFSMSANCVVNNQMYGVYALNSGGNINTFSCQNSTFTDNKVGIYFGLVPAAIVQNNTINIWSKSWGNASGIYIDNSSGFLVQNNTIGKGISGGGFSSTRYGIVANNTGANANTINNNTFSNLYKGSQAQYVNYASTPQIPNGTGLLYFCNTFVANSIGGADIYVPGIGSSNNVGATYTGTATTAGIGYAQGNGMGGTSNRITADNQFSHTSGGKDFWIESSNTYLSNYVYETPIGCANPASPYYPVVVNNLLSTCYSGNGTPNCSLGGGGGTHRSAYQNPITKDLAEAAEYKQTYDSLLFVYNMGHHSDSITQPMSAAFSARHLALNDAVRYFLHSSSHDSLQMGYALMKEAALELPARTQVETALNIHDSAWAAQSLSQVVSQEGQNNYVKLYTLLIRNISKTPEQIMQDLSAVEMMQNFDKDSTDRNTYLRANALLHVIHESDYVPYIQPEDSLGNDIAMRKQAAGIASNQMAVKSQSTLSNSPNPFKESVTIQAHVAEKTQNAYVLITDILGNEVARYPVQQGNNSLTLQAATLNQNVLFCTLLVNGVKITTNKMMMAK